MKHKRNTDSVQPALFTSLRWPRAMTPKRTEALAMVNKVIPWDELESLVRPYYQKDVRKTGRPGYSLRMMLRAAVLVRLWSVSFRQLETNILDSHAMAEFIGTDPWAPRPPSANLMGGFEKFLDSTVLRPDDIRGACLSDRLGDHVDHLILGAFLRAGIEFRRGVIQDPAFRRMPGAVEKSESGRAE